MKKVILLVIAIFTFSFLQAQQTLVNNDSTVVVKYYAGYVQTYGVDQEGESHFGNSARIGGDVQWNLGNHFIVRGFGVAEAYKSKDFGFKSFGNAFVGYKSNKLSIDAGLIASQFTLAYRPFPLSSGSQAEFGSQAMAPGASLGVRTTLSLKKTKIGLSINKRGNILEYQSVIRIKENRIGLLYSEEKVGLAYRYFGKNLDLYAIDYVTRDEVNHSGIGLYWTFNQEKNLVLLGDIVMTKTQFDWLEIGLGKSFEISKLKGLLFVSALYSDIEPNQMRIGLLMGI